MLVPLAVSIGPLITRSRRFWISWVLFNTVLVLLFGLFHQGGLFPMISELHRDLTHISSCTAGTTPDTLLCQVSGRQPLRSEPVLQASGDGSERFGPELVTKVVFMHTYMPPRHAFGIDHGTHRILSPVSPTSSRVEVIDLAGASMEQLHKTLKVWTLPAVTNETLAADFVFSRQPDGPFIQVIVVAPGVVDLESAPFRFVPMISVPFHLSMENLDKYLSRRSVGDLTLVASRVFLPSSDLISDRNVS